MRPKHPKKEVEKALRYAETHGWRVEVGGSHAWGKIYCPYNDFECVVVNFAYPVSGVHQEMLPATRAR